jgi:CRISPR-associated endonuclease/helicase Cas3
MIPLLAKSPRGDRKLALQQHLIDTEDAARALFRSGTRWASTYLRFFRLSLEEHAEFLLHLRVAALFHDVGKANSGFQAAVSTFGYKPQPFRHEHLSALVLAHPQVRAWLNLARGFDVDVVTAAVLSHHLKAADVGEYQVLLPKTGSTVDLYFSTSDVTSTLARIASLLDLQPLRVALPQRYVAAGSDWNQARDQLCDQADAFTASLRRDQRRLAMTMAVKAGLIAADSVASAMFRENLRVDEWIDNVAHRRALSPADIDSDILLARIAELESRRPGMKFHYHAFQEGAARLGNRALLLAGCGAGKTLAAWRWAKAVAARQEIGRVVFLYPTRGTATEGFRDYVAHAPEGSAALLHASAKYELASLVDNPDELPPSMRDKNFRADESEARLFALGLWPKRYFSATVDQFLAFVEHSYRGLCLVPALADSAVIFDEIHSYDNSMWRALTTFLSTFDVPVLCMTATLPQGRQSELHSLGLEAYPTAADRPMLKDLELAENLPRYRIESVADEAVAMTQVFAAAQRGQRILWVVNTVRRCQRVAAALTAQLARRVLVYHSRFTLDDRKDRHAATVAAFAPTSNHGAIAVTTQVCEMSLDLDADVLVSEHAPIPSLVQRFGRAHRHHRDGRPPANVIVYPPESHLPYTKSELDPVIPFLATIGTEPASQRLLAEGLIQHVPQAPSAARWTRFTSGGYYAEPGNLRDEDGSSTHVILDDQVETYLRKTKAGQPTDGLRLSVPRKYARPESEGRLPAWLLVADHLHYDRMLGFVEEPVTGAASHA